MNQQQEKPLSLVVSIDGVAPRNIVKETMPTLLSLADAGAACFNASTIRPSLTLPAHASMLRGVDAKAHGIFDNNPITPATLSPTFLKQGRMEGAVTARFTNWLPFECLFESDATEQQFVIDGGYCASEDDRIVDAASRLLRARQHTLVFVYLAQCDLAGHESGWDSESYMQALSGADRCLDRLMKKLRLDDTVVITTDHGGLGKHHQLGRPEDMRTFVVAKSPKIPAGTRWESANILQIPPTVAALSGFSPSIHWVEKSLV